MKSGQGGGIIKPSIDYPCPNTLDIRKPWFLLGSLMPVSLEIDLVSCLKLDPQDEHCFGCFSTECQASDRRI